MAFKTDPNMGLSYGADRGEDWETEGNADVKKIAAFLQLSVLTIGDNAPPGAPTNGDRYVVGSAPTGDWAGQADKLAVRIEGAWEFHTIPLGVVAFDVSADIWKGKASGGWTAV